MVSPVIGPTTKSDHDLSLGPGSRFFERVCYKQAKPFNVVTPYSYAKAITDSGTCTGAQQPYPYDMSAAYDTAGAGCSCSGSPPTKFATIRDQSVNLAREKFMASLADQALVAVNIAERRQAAQMMSHRLSQLAELVRLVGSAARGNRRALAQIRANLAEFSIPALKQRLREGMVNWRKSGRDAGSLWLEFHFGWEPLVKDVYNAIAVFDAPLPSGYVRARSRWLYSSYTNAKRWSDTEYYRATFQGRCRASVFGVISVTNLDLYRAQRLGLTNPAAVAWELIPFSFVVDWFATVSTYIDQFDGTLGLRLTSVGYNTKIMASCDAVRSTPANTGTIWTAKSSGVWFNRYTTLPSVTLGLKPAKPVSIVRGITAISLLLQQLKSLPLK